MKKLIALSAVLVALVGSAAAFAADPCACKGQNCKPQNTVQSSGLTEAELRW